MGTKNKMATKNTKFIITQSIFKLGGPDFSWLLILTLQKIFSKPRWPLKNKMEDKNKIDHNSVNFQGRSSIFCLVVYIDLPQNKIKTKMAAKKNKMATTKHKIDHNSVNFRARSSAPDFSW